MFKKLLIIAWVGLVGFSIGCKGPEGDVGPQGEKGDQGAVGAIGPAGANGDGGGTGASTISIGADTTDADGGFILGVTLATAAQATELQSAAVLAYVKTGGAYWAVPGIVPFGSAISNFTSIHYASGTNFIIEVFQTDWSESQDTAPKRIVQDVKVVIIPATILGRISSEVNLKSYEETIAALGIAEGNNLKATVRSK